MVEVLVGLCLAGLCISGIAASFSAVLTSIQLQNDRAHAINLAQHRMERLIAAPYVDVLNNRCELMMPHMYYNELGQADLLITTTIIPFQNPEFTALYGAGMTRPDQDYLIIVVNASWGKFQHLGETYIPDPEWEAYGRMENIRLVQVVIPNDFSVPGQPSPGNLIAALNAGIF